MSEQHMVEDANENDIPDHPRVQEMEVDGENDQEGSSRFSRIPQMFNQPNHIPLNTIATRPSFNNLLRSADSNLGTTPTVSERGGVGPLQVQLPPDQRRPRDSLIFYNNFLRELQGKFSGSGYPQDDTLRQLLGVIQQEITVTENVYSAFYSPPDHSGIYQNVRDVGNIIRVGSFIPTVRLQPDVVRGDTAKPKLDTHVTYCSQQPQFSFLHNSN